MMAMIGGVGRVLGAANASTLLAALNVEMGSLGRDMAAATANLPGMLQALQKSLGGIASTASTAAAAKLAAGQMSQVVAKVVFVAVLNEAINKASKSANFNVETAINDLWVHLDAARKFSGAGNAGAAGSPSIDVEIQKLKRTMQKRADLFDVLGKIMERYDQSAKNVIQSMRG
jgi:hypothetical protein